MMSQYKTVVPVSGHVAGRVDDALHGGVAVQPLHVEAGAPHVVHHQGGLVGGGQGSRNVD